MQVAPIVPQRKTGEVFIKSLPFAQQRLILSQEIIPAVRGEYYSYSSIFTQEQPLYALMKCKSNKARPISAIADLGSEVNALFQFNEDGQKILSIKTADTLGLLGGVNSEIVFDDIWIAPTNLTSKQFMELWVDKKEKELVSVCRKVINAHHTLVKLHKGLVVAMMISGGKYGMFLVSKVTPSLIKIEACHILL
ncbi:hypothetical protein A2996_00845 [Candidatus Campbellbacteria bacterium RIFCSPLOWO2_01_FULL_34_15]|uniref:Uncharacterized protein n=2 Tax=Candidatus Campbelliibacteriota TaxID=1752727 RepID=A0A1F5ENH0_9BACT|nr:MAG: hypothetical protein A2811_00670 [Candidatus Campbellbacteria bacterium RIFCSPHIGHO2_01_FULL_34_10]OGD68754.1 MAG: hypothetical protein A2996_00845 [Candidatus Campbellbacteria bacterium RIFCSPLOWO2_01_FULL_34_15]